MRGMGCLLIWEVGTWLYTYAKIRQTTYNFVDFAIYKLQPISMVSSAPGPFLSWDLVLSHCCPSSTVLYGCTTIFLFIGVGHLKKSVNI